MSLNKSIIFGINDKSFLAIFGKIYDKLYFLQILNDVSTILRILFVKLGDDFSIFKRIDVALSDLKLSTLNKCSIASNISFPIDLSISIASSRASRA